MSRAGWIAAAVAIAFFWGGTDSVKLFLDRHRYVLPLCVVLLMALATGVFLLKPESALGRLHIWHMETLAVLRRPFTGWGFGKVMGAYGIVQHDYFASAARDPWEIKVAGCPEYPFNEYLGAAMGGGLPALAIVLLILLLGINRLNGSPLEYGLVAFAVFSFASYPMSIPLFRVALAILLGAALAPSRPFSAVHWLLGVVTMVLIGGTIFSAKERQSFREAKKDVRLLSFSKSGNYHDGTADRLNHYYGILDDDFRYLYEYGMALHKEGRYRESNEVLLRGAGISSDPMFHNIIGRNYEALGDYENAEKEYRYSAFQVPSRLYPHILLMKLYLRAGDNASARDEAERILTMRVNPRNRNMSSLQEQALAVRDSLIVVHRLETH